MDIEKELPDGVGRVAVRAHPLCGWLPVSSLLQTQELWAGVERGEGLLHPLAMHFLAAVLLPFRGGAAVGHWSVSLSSFTL